MIACRAEWCHAPITSRPIANFTAARRQTRAHAALPSPLFTVLEFVGLLITNRQAASPRHQGAIHATISQVAVKPCSSPPVAILISALNIYHFYQLYTTNIHLSIHQLYLNHRGRATMLSSPPPAAALSTVLNNKSGGDLSATAITPGGPVTTNGHHGPHHPGDMSPSAPAIGTTPIEVTISGSTSPGSSATASSTSNGGPDCLCVGCHRPIRDRYLMCVSERYWHEACLQCTVCRIILTNSCYVKERKVYCKSDYNK